MKIFLRVCAIISAVAIFGQATASAQTRVTDTNAHGWYVLNFEAPVSSRWSIVFDGQYRRNNVITRWQQNLLRPAVTYNLNKTFQLGGGYGYVRTYPYGEYPFPRAFGEHRLFQQLIIRNKAGRTDLLQRIRWEERWLRALGPVPTADFWRLQQRIRLLSRVNVPAGSHWTASVWDELFLNVAPNLAPRVFDQNRFYFVLGKPIRPNLRIEAGYMNQFVAQRNGRINENNHSVVLILSLRAALRR